MKRTALCFHLPGLIFGILSCLVAVTGHGADAQPDYELRPLVTRYARTASKVTATAEFKAFRDVELQEAENFDGIGGNLDIVIPFAKRFQLRLYAPLYTSGHARLIEEPHRNIDLWGFSGTFDFANVQGDWQFLTQREHGVNMSLSGGVGAALRYLNTSTGDRYNHFGRVALGGLKLDRRLNDFVTIAANAGLRYYWASDDLNPAGDDVFAQADLSVAGIFDPFNHTLYPALELAYAGDFGGYNSILVVPQVIWPINSHFELKAGLTCGLTSNGEQFGARIQAVVRF